MLWRSSCEPLVRALWLVLSSESDNDFLETCRASTLLAELEDDDELPEPDDDEEDDDENEDGNEDEDEEFEEVTVSTGENYVGFICSSLG